MRLVTFLKSFDKSKHPRAPKGSTGRYRGGRFIPTGRVVFMRQGRAYPAHEAGMSQPAMIRPEYQADVSRLWQLETEKTYQSRDYPMLMVREALQNSIDAVKRARKTGGEVHVNVDPNTHSITVRDNGAGMSMATLQNIFLKLGATTKANEAGSVGGFGMAKAVILGCSKSGDWTIHTQDNVLHSHQIGQEADESAFKGPRMEGTEITVRDIRNWDADSSGYVAPGRTMRTLKDVLAASAGDANVAMYLNGERVQPLTSGRRGVELVTYGGTWGDGNDVTIKSYKKSGGGNARIVVRLGGLYQWSQDLGSDTLPKDVVVDITSSARPGTAEYPFTAGRDGFRWGTLAGSRYSDLRDMLKQEKYSGDRDMEWVDEYVETGEKKAPAEPETIPTINFVIDPHALPGTPPKVLDGKLEDGATVLIAPPSKPLVPGQVRESKQTTFGQYKVGEVEESPGAMRGAGQAWIRPVSPTKAASQRRDPEIEKKIKATAAALAPILKRFPFQMPDLPVLTRRNKKTYGRKKFDVSEHVPMLVAWDTISRLVAKEYGETRLSGQRHGTGFVLDPNVAAQAQNDEKTSHQFLLLNPDSAEAARKRTMKGGDTWGFTNHLYTLACHELAHLPDMSNGHNEGFTCRREGIAMETGHLLPVLNEVVKACFPTGARRDLKTQKASDPKYKKVLDAGRERAAAYHARQRKLRALAKEFGHPNAAAIIEAASVDKEHIAGMTPDRIERLIRNRLSGVIRS